MSQSLFPHAIQAYPFKAVTILGWCAHYSLGSVTHSLANRSKALIPPLIEAFQTPAYTLDPPHGRSIQLPEVSCYPADPVPYPLLCTTHRCTPSARKIAPRGRATAGRYGSEPLLRLRPHFLWLARIFYDRHQHLHLAGELLVMRCLAHSAILVAGHKAPARHLHGLLWHTLWPL